LLEQGLKQVMIAAVNNRDLNASVGQPMGRFEAAKSRAHNHNVMQRRIQRSISNVFAPCAVRERNGSKTG
jgi:hypothetical protein